MNPREMTDDQLIQFIRDAQFRVALGRAFPNNTSGLEGLRQRRLAQDNEIALREAEAELARRRSSGQAPGGQAPGGSASPGVGPDGQLRLREVDLNSLIRAVEDQAERNAERSIEMERRLNPEAFQARTSGQTALAELAGRGGVSEDQRRLLNQAIQNAAIVPRAIPLDQVSVPRVRTEPVRLPTAPVAPQLGATPSLSSAEVGNVNVPSPVLAERTEVEPAAIPERTEIQVSELQRRVEQKALDDLALGGQLSPEERAEVVRSALASAGAVGVTGGTARDITARDLGLSSMAIQRERAERARQVGLTTEERNARQARLDAQRQREIAEQQNLNARLRAQLEAARAQFNSGLISQAQLQQVENNVRIALQNASEVNQNARFLASLQDARDRFNAGLQSQYAMAAYEAAIRAGFTNSEAANSALRAEAQMLMNAREAERDRQFRSEQSALERSQQALRDAVSSLQDSDRIRLSAAQVASSIPRPVAGFDPSSVADVLISQVNQQNQLAFQNEAIRRQQQSANMAANALYSQLNNTPRLTATRMASSTITPAVQTVGVRTQEVQDWYRRNPLRPPSGAQTPSQLSSNRSILPPRI